LLEALQGELVLSLRGYGGPTVPAALWNGADTGGHFTRWALVVVIAYALKDRIKALLQARFAQVVSRSLPDRHWRIRDLERDIELGTMSEQSGFFAYRSVPANPRFTALTEILRVDRVL